MKTNWLFQYCRRNRVIDGDSLVLDIDTGFFHSAEVHVRLLGVDTPERNENPEGWRLARAFVENWFNETGSLSFLCTCPDKYGRRWNGIVRNDRGESLADALIESRVGVPYDGGARS